MPDLIRHPDVSLTRKPGREGKLFASQPWIPARGPG
jgi:hypothetical protein